MVAFPPFQMLSLREGYHVAPLYNCWYIALDLLNPYKTRTANLEDALLLMTLLVGFFFLGLIFREKA